jgi:hypothetical protein
VKLGEDQTVAEAPNPDTQPSSTAEAAKHKLASQPFFKYDDWAFYLGIASVGVLGLIEWPVVSVMAAGHAVSRRIHNKALSEALEGVESAE